MSDKYKKEAYNPKNYPIINQYPLQFSDMDRQSHINNIAYLRIAENMRAEVLIGGKLADEHTIHVVASIKADYLNELGWPGTVDTYTRVNRIGNSSFTMDCLIGQNNVMAFYCETVMVAINKETRKATPLTPRMRQLLKQWQHNNQP